MVLKGYTGSKKYILSTIVDILEVELEVLPTVGFERCKRVAWQQAYFSK